MWRSIARAAALILMSASVAEANAVETGVTALLPIPLQSGVNHVVHFATDGRDALVAHAWRDNGNAHGYGVWLVMLRPTPKADWNVVATGGDKVQDFVRDEPHTGEDVVRSVRFAHGKIDGRPATLLLTATRRIDASASIPAPSNVDFEILELTAGNDEVGLTHDYFRPVRDIRGDEKYCNADMALSRMFGLPLEASYEGPKTPNGC